MVHCRPRLGPAASGWGVGMTVVSIEQVLACEAKAMHDANLDWKPDQPPIISEQDAQDKRLRLAADRHDDTGIADTDVKSREALYRELNKLNRAALCCSGGGIRSATFCLGVIQALARHNVQGPAPRKRPDPTAAPSPGSISDQPMPPTERLRARGEERALEVLDSGRGERTAQARSDQTATFTKRAPQRKLERVKPEDSMLGRFHYLSTVSGGGYVGSWLSSWRTRDSFDTILDNLTRRPLGADVEPPEIAWLRAYSNYLTPRVGIGSADTWAAVAMVVRNLMLNWLVIIPVVCLALLGLKGIVTVAVWIARDGRSDWFGARLQYWPIILTLVVGVLCLIAAESFTTRYRPATRLAPANSKPESAAEQPEQPEAIAKLESASAPSDPLPDIDTKPQEKEKCILCRRTDVPGKCCLYRCAPSAKNRFAWGRTEIDDTCFVIRDLIWVALSAIAITIFFTSQSFCSLVSPFAALPCLDAVPARLGIPVVTAVAGFLVYLMGWLSGQKLSVKSYGDCGRWAASGFVYGALVGFGAYLFRLAAPCLADGDASQPAGPLLLAIVLGVPWVLMAQLIADNIFGGLVSYEAHSDSDREWLGRGSGWVAAFAVAWAVTAFLVFAAGYFVQDAAAVHASVEHVLTSLGGVAGILSGVVTALLGSSSKTPAKSNSREQKTLSAVALNVVLAIAGPLFAAVLIVALSIMLDQVLLGQSLIAGLLSNRQQWAILLWLGLGAVIAYAVARIASRCVNINRFSLHALYRNRLIRAYLGASRQTRQPDSFTGLDEEDNVRMHKLWPKVSQPDGHRKCLFHVINIALNVVSSNRLSWQQRKAESFTVSPLHCGSAYLGFRDSKDYGDSHTNITGQSGIALGTAMAISGAAVSPNMGYHSSPSLSLLLTLFNVRLGWWLGNPGEAGDKDDAFRREGPRVAAKPLFYEAFGQTTDTSAYVYLSDGGHFENLGLYEMVRRRCRFIVVIDAGCDPDFTFEDLGNAVRKIYIDLGIQIDFPNLDRLRNRPSKKVLSATPHVPYYAIGTIRYRDADCSSATETDVANGHILYIKPAYHGTIEGAGVRSYAIANPDFPHETTADQWFTESQFESYRSLGFEIAEEILEYEIVLDEKLTLHQALQRLRVQ